MTAQTHPFLLLRFVLVGCATAMFLLFVYGYPQLFPSIESAHPDAFERSVADAMADGQMGSALKIARRATRIHPYDPMAYTVYGRALLEAGDEAQALAELTKAVWVRREPPPSNLETRIPYYFAPARLTLGKHYFERDFPREAIRNFELARAYATPSDPAYRDFHDALYHAYAAQGLWARALEFGEPSDAELDALDIADIARIARISEGAGNWPRCARLAERLLKAESFAAEAHYLLGRALLAQHNDQDSLPHLEAAASSAHPHAAFFLGTALELNEQSPQAIDAYLRSQPGDPYRPFALAKAIALMQQAPNLEQPQGQAKLAQILEQLDDEIERARLLSIAYSGHGRYTPLTAEVSRTYFDSGGRFPIVVQWNDTQSPNKDNSVVSVSSPGTQSQLEFLRKGGKILQLQWSENLVNWDAVETLPPGAAAIPGWIDTARDWFSLRRDYAAEISRNNDGNSLVRFIKPTWLYSVPARIQDGTGYLIAGEVQRGQGQPAFTWQFLDAKEQILFEENIDEQQPSNEWKWQSSYVRPRILTDAVRVQLNAPHNPETVSLNNVMLVKIEEPGPD